MRTAYELASTAKAPWKTIDAAIPLINKLPQQEIEVCLMCKLCADACDFCDGRGNVSKKGRPTSRIDTALLREMLVLKRTNAEMCAALNISKNTLIKNKKLLMEEIQ